MLYGKSKRYYFAVTEDAKIKQI